MNRLAQMTKVTHACLLFLALSLCLFSCKKDNKEATPTIVGKWSVKSYVITNFENGGIDVDDTKDQKPRPTFEFKSDGTFTDTLEDKPQSTKYSLSGDKVTFDEGIAFDHNYFNYTIAGKSLTLKRTDTFKSTNNISYTENTTVTLERL